ncbi:Uncharacterised protein [Mycobacteroides abscessus subsp. abscessus]|nr:Uncharacterised protein [Mycobacteroides abscessus subsp. abscessus]
MRQMLEFLPRPLGLTLLGEHFGDLVAQLDKHLDIQCRVVQPVVGQGPFGPVGGAMALGQTQPQQPVHHGGQVHLLESGQAPGQFGVIERRWFHSQLGQAG